MFFIQFNRICDKKLCTLIMVNIYFKTRVVCIVGLNRVDCTIYYIICFNRFNKIWSHC